MKFIVKSFIRFCNQFFYPHFNHNDSNYSYLEIFKFGLMQKIIGFNRSVPWPVHFTSKVTHADKIDRGSKSPAYAIGCYLNGANGIKFGDNVWMGPRVTIASVNHNLTDYSRYQESGPVEIGRDSWLGSSCVILAGVTLGCHTIVAAGAVVTKSFPQGNLVIGGNPARIIKEIPAYEG